jgi:PAS domain S-box-containing protein
VRAVLVGLGEAEAAVARELAARGHVVEVCAAPDPGGPRWLEDACDVVVDRWPGEGRSGFNSWAASACGGAFILTLVDGEPDHDTVAAVVAAGSDDVIARTALERSLVERIIVAEQAVIRRSARRKAEAVTVPDVAAQLEEQEHLRELAEELSTTLDSIGDAVIACDAAGAITRMNPVAERLTGWAFAEARGRQLDEIFKVVDGRTRAVVESPVARALRQEAPVALPHWVLLLREGGELPIADSCAPIRGGDGVVRGAVLVFRDMSAERRASEFEEKAQRQLFIAERMASVGTLAAGAAHEINNPLSFVISNLDIALEDIGASGNEPASLRLDQLQAMLSDARMGAERVRQIVRGLQTFSQNGDESRAAVELRPVLELAARMAGNEIRHRARLVEDFREIPLVEVDAARLGQVFVNLLVNAAQAMPDGQSETNEIRVSTSTDVAGRAIVEIEDTGHGIPAAIVSRVFDPFFTTKSVGLGTGLGLSISRNIVEGMGGEIAVQSDEGRGTTVRIVLPAAKNQQAVALAAAAARAPPAAARAIDILVVDDEIAIGTALRRMLHGHVVTVVARAQGALDLLTAGKTFDVIFSDLMMPDMTGMDFHEQAARRFPDAARRIVFVTGGAFTPAAAAFLARVPNRRLEKPLDLETLRTIVRAASQTMRAPFESGFVELRPQGTDGAWGTVVGGATPLPK